MRQHEPQKNRPSVLVVDDDSDCVRSLGDQLTAAGYDVRPAGTGAEALCTVWRDDSFDPSQRAFYYARVVENPTCRWSWLQCNDYATANGVDWQQACEAPDSIPEGFQNCCLHQSLGEGSRDRRKKRQLGTYPETIQERAWTSPIWFDPGAS